jgi:hypothetical protein
MFNDFHQYKDLLESKLKNGIITPKILFNSCSFIHDNSRQAPAFYDNTWSTIYYYLGQMVGDVENICEVNFTLGLFTCAFLKQKSDLKNFIGFYPKDKQNKKIVPFRLGRSNIHRKARKCNFFLHEGGLYDDGFIDKFKKITLDVLIFSEINSYNNTLEFLDYLYPFVKENGLIIVDEYNNKEVKEATNAFCDSKNKKPFVFKTRYGTAILQK